MYRRVLYTWKNTLTNSYKWNIIAKKYSFLLWRDVMKNQILRESNALQELPEKNLEELKCFFIPWCITKTIGDPWYLYRSFSIEVFIMLCYQLYCGGTEFTIILSQTLIGSTIWVLVDGILSFKNILFQSPTQQCMW